MLNVVIIEYTTQSRHLSHIVGGNGFIKYCVQIEHFLFSFFLFAHEKWQHTI